MPSNLEGRLATSLEARVLYLGSSQAAVDLPSLAACIGITLMFGILAYAVTTLVAAQPDR